MSVVRVILDRFRAEVELLRRTVADAVGGEQILEITHSAFQVIDIGPGNFPFGDRVESSTLDADFLA